MFKAFLLVAALLSASAAPPNGMIENLPGWTGTQAMYSGYIQVDAVADRNLFFWLVESAGSPASDPLVLWTNGGTRTSTPLCTQKTVLSQGYYLDSCKFSVTQVFSHYPLLTDTVFTIFSFAVGSSLIPFLKSFHPYCVSFQRPPCS